MLPTLAGLAPITAKRDIIHETGSTYRSATSPEEDRATAKFRADRSSGSKDMVADRQKDRRTDRRVDRNTPHPYRGGVKMAEYIDNVTYNNNNDIY